MKYFNLYRKATGYDYHSQDAEIHRFNSTDYIFIKRFDSVEEVKKCVDSMPLDFDILIESHEL